MDAIIPSDIEPPLAELTEREAALFKEGLADLDAGRVYNHIEVMQAMKDGMEDGLAMRNKSRHVAQA